MKFDRRIRTGSVSSRIELLKGLGIVEGWQIQMLRNMGFFNAPASTRFHGAYEGGLFDHSYEVAKALAVMTDEMNLKWIRPQSPLIIGMFHDLCKADEYTLNHDHSKWEHTKNRLLEGHGSKSVMLLSQLMTLTEEEILCIRYHMGAYETDDWNGFDQAIRKYPNVLFTHTADMIASKVVGV